MTAAHGEGEGADSSLTLQLFGPFEARVKGTPSSLPLARKEQWLLALLALRAREEVERLWLAETLWPDSSPDQALRNLRNSLVNLRRALSPEGDRLRSSSFRTLTLDLSGASVDVVAFDQCIAHGDPGSLEQAVTLYRAPLLENCREEWVFQERQRREQAYLQALEALAASSLERGEVGAAESFLRRAVGVDPLRESTQRALMQALAAGGSYAAAMEVYRELRLLLHREMNAEPDTETQALFHELRAKARERAVLGAQCSVLGKGAGSTDAKRRAHAFAEHRALRTEHGRAATYTFLFTDIEGSSQLWEQQPEAMREALLCHDAWLREAIERYGGSVFKTMGDQFCAVFHTAPDALQAALEAQRRLQKWAGKDPGNSLRGSSAPDPSSDDARPPTPDLLPLRVRMALHTGMAEERGGDYFGPTLNRVARLLEVGHGGQVLLSQPSSDLVRDHLPQGTQFRDLGEHRLRHLVHPERVFQLLVPDLLADFPALNSQEVRTNQLPVQLTPLVGRQSEVETVRGLLRRAEVRLLTLTGPGGTGKTRLALQVATGLFEEFGDGVFFVDLAPILDPGLVASTIAQTLKIHETGGQPLIEELKAYLQRRELLLVLDNFEQVLSAAPLVVELLTAAPRLKVLVTSRAGLRVPGEQQFPVPPLAVPGRTPGLPIEALSRCAAVELFVQRAASLRPEFTLTEEGAEAVAEICRRLDGLPLAIELAAARIKLFSPPALLARMESRLKLLTGGGRGLPERQQTLRGTIAWSYDLLDESEKALFRQLAVFRGGCTVEAAEAVGGEAALEGIASLVDKSLLRPHEGEDGEPRFRMLETIREYAWEKLGGSEEAEAVRQRHLEFFVRLAEEAEPKLETAEVVAWLDRLAEEHDNLRAALAWAFESEPSLALRLAAALGTFWHARGYWAEGRAALESALSQAGEAPTLERVRALRYVGALANDQGDIERVKERAEESLELSRKLGDRREIARSLLALGGAVAESDSPEAGILLIEEGLLIAREIGDRCTALYALNSLGYWAFRRGDYEAARELAERVLAAAREQGEISVIAWASLGLGDVASAQGDAVAARSLLEEGLAIHRSLGNQRGAACALTNLGQLAFGQGEGEAARAFFAEGLTLLWQLGDRGGMMAESLEGLAGVARAKGQEAEADAVGRGAGSWAVRAARLCGAAEALREATGSPISPPLRAQYEETVSAAHAALGEEAFAAAWAEGRAMSPESVVPDALET